ncbi:MAG: hypothetical protein KIT18_04245 [Burkholderiales bacterium]|nr:hypothetical protein [Burkholderiales bacterium]
MWLFLPGPARLGFAAIWGFFVISGIDKHCQAALISRGASLPFALVLLGVFGVLAFGLPSVSSPATTLLAVGFNLLDAGPQTRAVAPSQKTWTAGNSRLQLLAGMGAESGGGSIDAGPAALESRRFRRHAGHQRINSTGNDLSMMKSGGGVNISSAPVRALRTRPAVRSLPAESALRRSRHDTRQFHHGQSVFDRVAGKYGARFRTARRPRPHR